MRNRVASAKVVLLCLAMTWAIGIAADAAPDSNVAGLWNIKLSRDAGSAAQTIVLQQVANKITRTRKRPRQSGDLEGTLGGEIRFHGKTRVPVDYTGTVDDTMKGTMSGKGKPGDWSATRAS